MGKRPRLTYRELDAILFALGAADPTDVPEDIDSDALDSATEKVRVMLGRREAPKRAVRRRDEFHYFCERCGTRHTVVAHDQKTANKEIHGEKCRECGHEVLR